MKTHHTYSQILGIAVLIGLLATGAQAGGIQSGAFSARAIALGGSLAGLPDDASSLFANPAALSFLRGTHLTLGATVTMPTYEFTGIAPSAVTTKMKPQTVFPPNLVLTHTFASGFGIGISATVPYQMKTNWGEDWIGSTLVTSSEMRAAEVTPSVAFRITPALSLGLGAQILFVRMDLNRQFGLTPDPTTGRIPLMYMTGSADVAYSFEIGMMYHIHDVFTLGIGLKSRTQATITGGSVDYSVVPVESSLAGMTTATFSSSITLPDRVRLGATVQPLPGVLLTGEIDLMRWSSFKSLTVRVDGVRAEERVEQRGWKDALAYRAGLEVCLSDVLLRAGLAYEPSPIPDTEIRPSVPDVSRMVFGGGLGYVLGEGLMLDIGLQFAPAAERTVSDSRVTLLDGRAFNGTYRLSGTSIALSLSYSWK